MPREINWDGAFPNCDFCIVPTPAQYDGKTHAGPWANMCNQHLNKHGYPESDGLTLKRKKG